jgi:hypothetical protein
MVYIAPFWAHVDVIAQEAIDALVQSIRHRCETGTAADGESISGLLSSF